MVIRWKVNPIGYAIMQKNEQTMKRRGQNDAIEDARDKDKMRLGKDEDVKIDEPTIIEPIIEKPEVIEEIEEPVIEHCINLTKANITLDNSDSDKMIQLQTENEELKRAIEAIQRDIVEITNEQMKYLIFEAITSEDLPTEGI